MMTPFMIDQPVPIMLLRRSVEMGLDKAEDTEWLFAGRGTKVAQCWCKWSETHEPKRTLLEDGRVVLVEIGNADGKGAVRVKLKPAAGFVVGQCPHCKRIYWADM